MFKTCKTFVLLFGLLCFTSAQADPVPTPTSASNTSEAASTAQEIQIGSGNERTVQGEAETEEPQPDLTCILFDNIGCNATCQRMSELYGKSAKGTCTANQHCICEGREDSTIESLWYENFERTEESENLLKTITDNSELSAQVKQILQRFPRTPNDVLIDLISEVPNESDYIDLEPKKKNLPIERFVNTDDSVIREELRGEISNVLRRELNTKRYPIDGIKYHAKLRQFLQTHADTQTHVLDEIHKTHNIFLKKFLTPEQRQNQYDFDDQIDWPSFHVVTDSVATSVVDEFVKYIERRRRTLSKPRNRRISTEQCKNIPRRKYQTPYIPNFTSVQNFDVPFKREYNGGEGTVEVEIQQDGTLKIDWQIDNTKVQLARSTNDEIRQNWQFDDGTKVELINNANGDKQQLWNMAGKTFKYYETANGSIIVSGNATDEQRARYENEIKSWCQENTRIFPLQKCIIYNRRSVQSTKSTCAGKNQEPARNYNYRPPAIARMINVNTQEGPYKRQMFYKTFDIDLQIDRNGAFRLFRRQHDVKVNHYTLPNNKIVQSWTFGDDANIFIAYYENGVRDQVWKIGEKTYRFLEGPGADVIPSCDDTPKDIAEYKHNIDAWCTENILYYRKGECAIYDKRSANPILPTAASPTEISFVTPQIDNFTSIDRISGPFKRSYIGPDGTVYLERWENENLALQWSFGNTIVNLVVYDSGKIEQLWKFGDAFITITKNGNGDSSIDQYWDLIGDYYEFHQTSQGQKTTSGTASEAKVGEFENKIKTWCETNQHIYPLPQCIIYERT